MSGYLHHDSHKYHIRGKTPGWCFSWDVFWFQIKLCWLSCFFLLRLL